MDNLPRPMYKIKSPNGVIMDDKYYQEELQVKRGDEYKIESILKKRKRKGVSESLVKWVGWPDPTWEKTKNISQINSDK